MSARPMTALRSAMSLAMTSPKPDDFAQRETAPPPRKASAKRRCCHEAAGARTGSGRAGMAAGDVCRRIAGEGGVEFHDSFLTKLLEDHKRLQLGISNEEGVGRAVSLGPAQVGDFGLVGEVPLGIDEDQAHLAADVWRVVVAVPTLSCLENAASIASSCASDRRAAVLVLG